MRAAFQAWLDGCPPGAWVALHDYDADGISAGVLWALLAQHLGREHRRLAVGTLPGSLGSRDLDLYLPMIRGFASAFFALDLGSRRTPFVEGIPSLYIDHHPGDNSGSPSPLARTLQGRELDPSPCTSVLMYMIMEEVADFSARDWIAALGAYSDLGDSAPFAVVERSNEKYGKKDLREITGLVNSGRRGPRFQPDTAAQALLEHETPREFLESKADSVEALRIAKAAAQKAFRKAKAVSPRYAKQMALLTLKTPCRIHGLVAQLWRNRLPERFVLVGNVGLAGDHVEFSVRCRRDYDALEWLRPHAEPLLGRALEGHPQACGGRLTRENWDRLLEKLGYGPSA